MSFKQSEELRVVLRDAILKYWDSQPKTGADIYGVEFLTVVSSAIIGLTVTIMEPYRKIGGDEFVNGLYDQFKTMIDDAKSIFTKKPEATHESFIGKMKKSVLN